MNGKTKTKIKLVVLTLVTCSLLALISFGYFYTSSNQNDKNRLSGGCFNTSFTDGDSVSLTNAFPESFEDSKKEEPYEFTLTNTCSLQVKYYILLNVKEGSFNPDYIDYSINNTSENKLYNALENTSRFSIDSGYNKSFIIGSGLLKTGSKTENIRLWIDENVNASELSENSEFTAQIKVVGEVSTQLGTDKILNLVQGANTNSTDIIEKPAPEGSACTNTLAYDGTVDNNLRYVGANPCNYVSFNNELWRIIGVMNNIDDGTGNLETRIKLIKNESIGYYAWDSSDLSVHDGYGVNDWSVSDLMRELNGDYLNTKLSTNTMWYGHNNDQTREYDYTQGLKSEYQVMLGDVKWHLGRIEWEANNLVSSTIYTKERGTESWGNLPEHECNDGACPRSTSWTGKVALIYPSDYGFAVGGNNRNSCLSTNLGTYTSNDNNCIDNNYIFTSDYKWLLSPSTVMPNRIHLIYNTGYLANHGAGCGYAVYPSVFLKSDISIISGNGSESSPYVLK